MKKSLWLLVGMIAFGFLLIVAAAVGLLMQSGLMASSGTSIGPPRVGARMAGFTLDGIDGQPVSLSDYKGRPVLVNFWATWCPPCLAEMPYLDDFYQAHQESGLVILAVNTGEPLDLAAAYAWELGVSFPVLTDPDETLGRRLAIHSYPTSIFIDKNGIVQRIHTGMFTPEQLDEEISPYLIP